MQTNDLISRERLKDKFVAMREYAQTFMFKTIFGDLIEVIEREPAVDAAPVVHGRWKYFHKQNIAVCMNCSFERDLDANFGAAVSCPNCGAKMDGDK